MNALRCSKRDKRGAKPGLLFAALIAAALWPHLVRAADEPSVPLRDDQVKKVHATTVTSLDGPLVLPVVGGTWISQGPGPIFNGQVEGITNGHVLGAIQTIVAHPTNADIVWIGAVNGGIWKTTNATNATPTWTSMGDAFSSLSIGALNLDPTDATRNTLVGGFGRFSSFGSVGGPRAGLLRTTDGGTNWTALTPAALMSANITGIAARGTTIVVSVNLADNFNCGDIGIFRSVDTGSTFSIVSGTGGTALPEGLAFDLAGDPTNNAVLYTAIKYAPTCGGGVNGVYKSINTGATWTKVSNAAMDAMLTDDANAVNTRIAVGMSGEVYAGIIDMDGHLTGLFRSSTGGPSWTQLDTPSTNEGGSIIGIQPEEESGGQGATHFSIVADPTNVNIVYVGGDRQPLTGDGAASSPNSIGANDYSGRLFRVNASAGPGSMSTPLTHCQTATAACNGTISTTSNSAPHADSRRMAFDAGGNILEADDGGIYRRTNPRTTGDWFSAMGNLRVTEMHDVAYDRVSKMIVGGNQDTGSAEQTSVGGTTWSEINEGDGGDVAVDDFTSGTQSTRFTSAQGLGGFERRVMNSSGVATSSTFPALTVTGGGPDFSGQFVTPIEVNAISGPRLLLAGINDLYESLDRGDTITALSFNKTATAMVYGGRASGVDNVNLIYAISPSGPTDANVFVRTAGSGAPVLTATSPGSTSLNDIAVDPANWHNAYVVNDIGEVYSTSNTGGSWTNITGNLAGGTTDLRSIVFVPGIPSSILVGGINGVFRMATDIAGVWQQFGAGLSNAPVWDLDYEAADDTLVASTMGRGAWKLSPVGNTGIAAPTNTLATATGPTTVNVTWTASAGAASYRVYRNSGAGYSLVGSPSTTTFNDSTVSANTAYLYLVRAFSGTESGNSNVDLATTVIFTDPTLTANVTLVKLAHFTELLTAVNAVRALAGLPSITFSAPAPSTTVTVRRQHVLDLRIGLVEARSELLLSAVSYTDPSIIPASTTIRAAHIQDIRDGMK